MFFLLALAAWALPRALTVAWRLVTHDVLFANVTPLTMDTAITVGLAVLAALWLAGRQRAAPPGVLLFVLIVSTLVAGPGLLLPVFWDAGFLFYLSLLFPVAYQFLFRARELNEPGPGRQGRVLWEVGMSCALLTIAAFRAAAGLALPGGIDPVTQLLEDAGTLYLMIPFAAILVAAAVTSWPAEAAPEGPPTAAAGTAPARTV